MKERTQTNQKEDVEFSESAREKKIARIFFARFTQEQDPDRRVELVQQARGGRSLNALSPDQQKAVIRKIVEDYVVIAQQKEGDAFREACKVTDAFLPSVRKKGTKDIVDVYASLFPEFLQQYPDASRPLTNLLDQNARMVDPEIYLKSIATILRQPGIDPSHKTGAIAGLSYQASFGLLPFLESKLQAIEETSVEEAATLLTLLNAVRSYGTNWDFSVESSQKIESMLIAFHKQTKSALLKRKAASVLKRFVNIGTGWTPKAVRAWMKYNPHDFGDISEEEIVELSDAEVMDEWHDALLDPDFQQVVFLNDQSIILEKAQKRQGTDRISVGRRAREHYIILPIARGYFGCFSLSGNMSALIHEQPQTTKYSEKDLVSLHELSDIALQPWMSQTQTQEALQAQRDFQMMLDYEVLKGIEEDFGFPVQELTLREQIWFMAALRDMTPESEKQIIAFTKKFGVSAARAFLSVEADPGFRDRVLALGEKLASHEAQAVFDRYGEIALLAQEATDEIIEVAVDTTRAQLNPAVVSQELLRRAKELLVHCSMPEVQSEDVVAKLEKTKSETVLFGGICKAYFKNNPEAKFEAIRGMNLETRPVAALTQKEKAHMLMIEKENWNDVPTMTDFVMAEFQEKLSAKNQNVVFHLLKKGEKIVSFIRFDGRSDGDLYAGSFNVDPKLRDSGVGEAMLRATLDQEARVHRIHANVYPDSRVGTAYVEKFGFVIVGVEQISLPNGQQEEDFVIVRDDQKNVTYKSRAPEMSIEKLIQLSRTTAEQAISAMEVRFYDVRKHKREMLDDVRLAAERHEIITRYFCDPKNSFIRYFVFEKIPSKEKRISKRRMDTLERHDSANS